MVMYSIFNSFGHFQSINPIFEHNAVQNSISYSLRNQYVEQYKWPKYVFVHLWSTKFIANVASENRYTVRVPRGETIYYASEISQKGQRNCFGSSRAFQMQVHDPTNQLAFTFKRNLACGTCCTCWCCLQVLEVYMASGEYMGCTEQKVHCSKPLFSVKDKFHNTTYCIKGPNKMLCLRPEYLNFQIYASDGFTQVGSIVHQWDSMQVAYNTIIQFPNRRINNHLKVLLLGAAFLMEYMYFEDARRIPCKCIC